MVDLLKIIVIGILGQPKSAINNLVSNTDFLVAFKGINKYSTGAVARSLKEVFRSPWFALLETFGHTPTVDPDELTILEVSAEIHRHDISFKDNLSERGFQDQIELGLLARGIKPLRVFGRLLSQPFGKVGEERRVFAAPSLNAFDYVTRISNHGIAMGMLKSYKLMLNELIDVMQNSTSKNGVPAIDDASFHFKKQDLKSLGIDVDTFDFMQQEAIGNVGFSMEQWAREIIKRRAKGERELTKRELYGVAQIAMNRISLNSDINTRPVDFMTGIRPNFTVLLGWPVTKMAQISKAVKTEEGDIQWRMYMKLMANMAIMSGIGIAFTMLTDLYDEIFRGKTPNLRKLDLNQTPEQNLLAAVERTARIGTFGLAGDLVNSMVNYVDTGAGQKGISLDDRIVVMSILQGLVDSVAAAWQQGGVSWATVGQPLMQSLGGNGLIQYAEIMNNTMGDVTGDIPLA